jgi:hypothetical protein
MKRNLYEIQYNLPENLTDLFKIFQLFFSKELMESFAKYINKYAKREIKRRQEKDPERLLKYKKWKFISIGKTYIFLGILIHMSSEKILKIKNY